MLKYFCAISLNKCFKPTNNIGVSSCAIFFDLCFAYVNTTNGTMADILKAKFQKLSFM